MRYLSDLHGMDEIVQKFDTEAETLSFTARHLALVSSGSLDGSEQAAQNIDQALNHIGMTAKDTLYLTRGSEEDIAAREALQAIGAGDTSSKTRDKLGELLA